MKWLITLFLMLLITSTFVNAQNNIPVDSLTFNEDSICTKDSALFTGVAIYRLGSGNKKTINYDEGIKTGKWRVTNLNNKKIAIGIRKDEKDLSTHYEYHSNDSLKVLRKKVDGELIRKIKYYQNGKIEELINYQPDCINVNFILNGVPDSLIDENGEYGSDEFKRLMYPLEQARKILTDSTIYVFDGSIAFNDNYAVPHGKWTKYYKNGEVKEEREYLYGIKTGTWIYKLEDGNKYKSIDYNIYTHIKKEYEFYPKTETYKSQKLWYKKMEYGFWKEWDFQGRLIEEIEKLEVLKNPLPNAIIDYTISKDYFKKNNLLDSIMVTRNMPFPVGFKLNNYLITLKKIDFSYTENNGRVIYNVRINAVYKSTAFILSLSGCSQKNGDTLGSCNATFPHMIISRMSDPKPGEPNGAIIMDNVFLTDLYVHSKFNKWTAFKIVLSEYKEIRYKNNYQPE